MGLKADVICTVQRLRMESFNDTPSSVNDQQGLLRYDIGEEKRRFYQLRAERRNFRLNHAYCSKEEYDREWWKLLKEIRELEIKLSSPNRKLY